MAHTADHKVAAQPNALGEGVVNEFLRERREEAGHDNAQHPLTMSREQFEARLEMLRERTLKRQAERRAAKPQEERRAA